jgi:hypothetical protein
LILNRAKEEFLRNEAKYRGELAGLQRPSLFGFAGEKWVATVDSIVEA